MGNELGKYNLDSIDLVADNAILTSVRKTQISPSVGFKYGAPDTLPPNL